MYFTLSIKIDNDAFLPDPSIEVARILEELAEIVEKSYSIGQRKLYDRKGNKVGWTIVQKLATP